MTNRYLRDSAVRYARTYALKPNPYYRYFPLINNDTSGDCTNFVSQCLLAGGATMNYNELQSWWYKSNSYNTYIDDTWSITWTVAHSLYWLLKVNQEKNSLNIKGLEVNTTKNLELGDLIFFEDNNNVIFHATIITAFKGNIPLISEHSFEALDIPYTKSWKAKRWHFLKISI